MQITYLCNVLILFIMNKFDMIILSHKKSKYWYLTSFLIPFFIFFIYFWIRKGQILTVDLGQQYIDLLAFYKHNLLANPLNLIYSFNNGLGNSMVGTVAYYLASPLNLILLIFPKTLLPIGILVLISLKIGLIGLTSYFYFNSFTKNNLLALIASIAYSLSGFVITNNLNLMWLDSVYLLPLLIWSIDRQFINKKSHLIIITFALWITNFYTGYMIILFGLLYFVAKLILENTNRTLIFKKYLIQSVLGTLIASFLLIPTVYELMQGKTCASVDYNLNFAFPLQNLLAKLISGSFSFKEMSWGMPNIFWSTPLILIAISFIFSNKIKLKTKIVFSTLFAFLIISCSFNPLILLWHMGQYPIWYQGRFSFCISFLGIYLASLVLNKQNKFTKLQLISITLFGILEVSFSILKLKQIEFLTQDKITITALIAILTIIILFYYQKSSIFSLKCLFFAVLFSSSLNLITSLQNITYQNNSDYTNFSLDVSNTIADLKSRDNSFYRVEKSFSRSDDDSFSSDYNGLATFNSISNTRISNFIENIGFDHNNNSYINNFSTPITDDLLGVKYYLVPNYHDKGSVDFTNLIYRNDLNANSILFSANHLTVFKNNYVLPLLFISKKHPIDLQLDAPINNQNQLFSAITGSKDRAFYKSLLPKANLTNIQPITSYDFKKINKIKRSYVTYYLKPIFTSSYYLELPPSVDDSQTSLTVNNNFIPIKARTSQNKLINLGYLHKNQTVKISFELTNNNLDLANMQLWAVNSNIHKIIKDFNKNQPTLKYINPLVLKTSNFKTNSNQIVNTTIPYDRNWLVLDKNKLIKTSIFAKTFLQVKLSAKQHQLTLIYIPWSLIIGILISLIAIIFWRKIKASKLLL